MPSFNLVDDPWLICRVEGKQSQRLSLRETIAHAHELTDLDESSPVVAAALYRFLLALLHRLYGPSTVEEWLSLWNAERFPPDPLDEYCARWRERFELFDERHPFLQDPTLKEERASGLDRLIISFKVASHFEHNRFDEDFALEPGEAAKHLIALQTFALGGKVTHPVKGNDSAADAPAARAALVLLRGENLFQTLLLNMVRYSPADEEPFPAVDDDAPAWEKEPLVEAGRRFPDGYLDLLTWRSRRVKLYPTEYGRVKRVVVCKGDALANGAELKDFETQTGFTKRVRVKKNQDPWPPLRLREDRSLWRDSLSLLALCEKGYEPPGTIAWLGEMRDAGNLAELSIVPLEVRGCCTNLKKVEFWRSEGFPLPLSYLAAEGGGELVQELRLALGWAEEGVHCLNSAVFHLAVFLVAPAADLEEGRQPDRADVQRIKDKLGAVGHYWSNLEVPFHQLLVDLPRDCEAAQKTWAETVLSTIRRSFWHAVTAVPNSAHGLKAAVKARDTLKKQLYSPKAKPELTAFLQSFKEVKSDG